MKIIKLLLFVALLVGSVSIVAYSQDTITPEDASKLGELNWLKQVGTFIGTYGLAVFLVVYYVLKMYPQVSAERKEWIAEVTRLESLVNPDTRPVTLSQAEVVSDIAIDAYMNRLSTVTANYSWRGGRSGKPGGWGLEKVPEGCIRRAFLGESFEYHPKSTDETALRKMVHKFADLMQKVNSECRAQLLQLLKRADESAEKIQYQLARLRFQDDSLATPWNAALTVVRKTWQAKLKDLDFVETYDRRGFLEFIAEHPAYDQLKDDKEILSVVSEIASGVEELLELTKSVLKSAFSEAMRKRPGR
jgi:hypothetical protein